MGLGLAFGLFLGAAIGVSRALNREPKTVILSDAKDLCNLPPAPRCPRLQRSLGPQKARGQDDKHQIRIANFALSISLLHAGIIRRVDVVELYR